MAKRRVSLLKTLSRPVEAIAALVEVLETSPTDLEAWAELSDLYFAQAMYTQACFCLEEVLLITPNAWNVCIVHFYAIADSLLVTLLIICNLGPRPSWRGSVRIKLCSC